MKEKNLFIAFVFYLSSIVQYSYAVDWKGNQLADVLATANSEAEEIVVCEADRIDKGKTLFLYNPSSGKFLYQGEAWDTQTMLSDVGIRCWVLPGADTGSYYIETACKNSQNTNKKDFLAINSLTKVFCDCTVRKWTIEPVTEGSNEYYIHGTDDVNDPDGNERYLYAADNSNLVLVDVKNSDALDGHEDRAKWIFVTEQDLIDEFKKTTVELGGVPADATFMIDDADFHRYSAEQDKWEWTPGTTSKSATLYIGINKHYQKYDDETQAYVWVVKGDRNGGDNVNGKYWIAKIIGGTGTMSQTVSIAKSGWYQLQCQGEYYAPDVTSNQVAYLFAKTDNGTIKSPLRMCNSEIAGFTSKAGSNTEGQRYYDEFGNYTNSLMIYVDCGEDNANTVQLSLGITVEGDNVSEKTGVAVDAFRLKYIGMPDKHDLVLDEDFTNFDYILDETDKEYQNSTLYLHRSLKKNMWNTIILPVNLTAMQFDETFGTEAKLARFNGVRNNRLQFIVQDDKTIYDTEEKGAFLKANTPYIIYPAIEAEHTSPYSYTTTSGEDTESRALKTYTVTVGTPYYVVNNVSMDKTNVDDIVINGTESANTLKDGYAFNGILVKDYNEDKTFIGGSSHVKAGDYTFNQGQLYPFKKDYGMKGFRGWFSQVDNSSSAKPFGVEINGISGDEVTGIDSCFSNNDVRQANIYNINGQRVQAATLQDLPSGIYVVNHKKYIVK